HGDFDVDGICATTIVWDFLYRKLGADAYPIIPNRFTEGYGLSESTIRRAKELGAGVIITVDCGIKDINLIKKHPEIQFIITDHHTYPTNDLNKPQELTADNLIGIVHPQDPESNYPFKDICGAAVAWKFVSALNSTHGDNYDMDEYLFLVALATVTDLMPLLDENRFIVKQALHNLNTKEKPLSIKSLLEVANNIENEIEAYHFGFVIGPRLNAAGRLEDAIEAVKLMSTQNEESSKNLARKLNELNTKRQDITQELLNKAELQIENHSNENLIFVYGEDWPEGILGLIAGKLCEKYHKPVLAASINKDGNYVKGSARSISKYNISSALKRSEKLLDRYGGHAQAAGFGLKLENLDAFIKSLQQDAKANISLGDLVPITYVTKIITIAELNNEFLNTVDLFKPFGFGNPKPLFAFSKLKIRNLKLVGKEKQHVQFWLEQGSDKINAIGFNMGESAAAFNLDEYIDVIGSPKLEEWNGNKTIKLFIHEFRKHDFNNFE
ncbi:MAG: single-stranded-DNA-specific exonuclease RecJ, partial [Ignavibacteriae bacterium]|nr:single-stranded-DNA-specific exonuclease RecJ [Ignavibacteriota bacterium]